MNPPTTSIDDLPPEIISELFKHLSLKDLAACSQVSKRWHLIYADFRLQRLVVTDYEHHHIPKWFHSGRRVEEQQLCHPKVFRRLRTRPLLSNLKHLSLSGQFIFDFEKLNRFRQLVHLEIDLDLEINLKYSSAFFDVSDVSDDSDDSEAFNGEAWHFVLPRLQVLAFRQFNYRCRLSIDCPALSELSYGESSCNLMDLKHPETIKKLATSKFDPNWLSQFKGVECLVARQFGAISKSTLLSLPRLKELHYDKSIADVIQLDFGNEVGALQRMSLALEEFVDGVKELRGDDFQFTFAGFRPTKTNMEAIDFGNQVIYYFGRVGEGVFDEYVYLKNYELIDPDCTLDFIGRLDYDRLVSYGEIPNWIFQRFTGVWLVQVDGAPVQDEAHFLWFLKSLRSPERLILRDVQLSQEFYDQLPACLPTLKDLFLTEIKSPSKFDFISQISNLTFIKIKLIASPSFELLTSFVRSCAKLVKLRLEIDFSFGGTRFEVRKGFKTWPSLCSESWQVRKAGSRSLFPDAESKNPEEILNFFEKLYADASK